MSKFKVGDTVMMTNINGKPCQTKVSRVGRINVFVSEFGRDRRPFDIESGRIKNEYSHHCIYTMAEWEKELAIKAAYARISDAGVKLESTIRGDDIIEIANLLSPWIERRAMR